MASAPSTRGTFNNGNIDSTVHLSSSDSLDVTNAFAVNSPILNSPILYYAYNTNQGASQDFSNINAITLTSIGATAPSSITISLYHFISGNYVVYYTASVAPVSNVFTWPIAGHGQSATAKVQFNLDNFPITTNPNGLTYSFSPLASSALCLWSLSTILMADGSDKPICDILRGDLIKTTHGDKPVSQVLKQIFSPNLCYDILRFDTNCLGNNYPKDTLYITKNHPIIYNGARRPAHCFRNMPGVTYYEHRRIEKILPSYAFYDLQFDVDTTFIANGVEVQSRSPFSDLTPLPLELYHDPGLYKNIKTWDSVNQKLPLDQTTL